MIVRILGEGQLRSTIQPLDELNELDTKLEAAVERSDEAGFRAALTALLARVRAIGTPVEPDALEPSGLILPQVRTRPWTRSASCSRTTGSSPAEGAISASWELTEHVPGWPRSGNVHGNLPVPSMPGCCGRPGSWSCAIGSGAAV